MGLEAEVTVRVGRKTTSAKAHLESEALILRGEQGFQIPFDTIREASVAGDELVIRTAEQETRIQLGPGVAERWLRYINEPRSLLEKLELGPQSRVAVVDLRDPVFLTTLRDRTANVSEGRVPEGVPVIFFAAETRDALRKLQLLRARMIDTGVLWVVRPKGSKEIGETDVFEAIRALGLVDTKVVAFSKTHTAHKCVIPVDQRGVVRRRAPIVSIPPSAPALRPTPSKKSASGAPGKASKPGKPPVKKPAATTKPAKKKPR